MPSQGYSPVPIDLGSASTDTQEARAFFQDRLRLYTGWVFTLSFGFYVLNLALGFLTGFVFLREPGSLAHLAASVVLGTIWLVIRSAPRSQKALTTLDSTALVLTCLLFAAMGTAFALARTDFAVDPTHALLIGQLACMSTILTRAVALPSTPWRTFWLGFVALLPQMSFAAYVFYTSSDLPRPPALEHLSDVDLALGALANMVAWNGVALAISTVGSKVIFGLRAEADKIKRLGQYTLEEKIGEGGMGIVYRASHAMLRRPTAIKLLPPDKAGEDSIRRFEREVQLTAQLSHPNTVAVFDYGRTPTGVFYYAMEYLDGLTLNDLVALHGPQEPARVVHILAQVSGALVEAHENRLIHRDIKPANIILCERGGIPDVAKVVDFGLVKSVVPDDTAATVRVTGQSVLTGTPQFMAPEAIRGEQFVDGRSDIYALGGVGIFLLTGEPVFAGDNLVEVVAHHLHTVPTPPSARGFDHIPSDIEKVLMHCLEKQPEARYDSARDLGVALASCARSNPWSLDRAAQFWTTRRHDTAKAVSTPASGAHPTLDVDIEKRIT